MAGCYWLLLSLIIGLSSCNFNASFGSEEAIQADLVQVFASNKQQLLKKRALLLQQIELLAIARQGSYLPLISSSKKLLTIGQPTSHLLAMTQAELLQEAKLPPMPQQPSSYWTEQEATLMNYSVGKKLLFGKGKLAQQIVEQWLALEQAYQALLEEWNQQPVVQAKQFPFEDHPYNQLFDWKDSSQNPEELAKATFKGLPLISSITKLLQLETDILTHEVQLLSWLLDNLSKTYLIQDKFTIVANPISSVVEVGEPYQATVQLLAYSSLGDLEIMVNGNPLPTEEGIAYYSTIPEQAGEQTLEIEVWVTNPANGKREQYKHTVSYQVLSAMQGEQ